MATIPEFIPPAFLQGQTLDDIHNRMMAMLPAEIDKGEGGFPWDFTRPAANEKAELVNFVLMNAIMALFPQWASGIMLDYHADCRGMERRPAAYARGVVTITAPAGMEIPAGFGLSTPAGYNTPGAGFRTDKTVTIDDTGSADIPVTAVNPGVSGNVAAGTIILMDEPITGILSILNQAPTTGGLEEESDDELRGRVVEYDRNQGVSFVGSETDFRRWTMEVPGVGSVKVVGGQNGDGVVKLIVTGTDGKPASTDLQTAVYNHIMRPDARALRLAGVNCDLRVQAPDTLNIAVAASVTLDGTSLLDDVKTELAAKLDAYYQSAEGAATGVIRWTAVGALLLECAGVTDYTGLTINGGTDNIAVETEEIPLTGADDITLTEATA